MADPIDFYFDFSSPYGYIAARLIDGIGARHGRAVRWRPILLGAIFKLTAAAPLVDIPLKRDYALRDFPRSARLHGIPFQMPDPFPFSAVNASRAFYWLDASDPAGAHRLARALYDAPYAGRLIASPADVAAIAAELGHDRDAVLDGIAAAETKERTRAENDAATARGVFGSPFIIVDGEPFWGADRLDQIDNWLRTGGW